MPEEETVTAKQAAQQAVEKFINQYGHDPPMIVMSRTSLVRIYMEVNDWDEKTAKSHLKDLERRKVDITFAKIPVKLSPAAKGEITATNQWP